MMRQSLIYNLLLSLILIITILYLLFQIAPHTATMSFSGNSNVILLNSRADDIMLKVYNTYSETRSETIEVNGNTHLSDYDVIYDDQCYHYSFANNKASDFILVGSFLITINNTQDYYTTEEIDKDLSELQENRIDSLNQNGFKGISLWASPNRSRRKDRMELWGNMTENEFIPDFFKREDNEASAINAKYYCSISDDLYTIEINGYHIGCGAPELRVTPMSNNCYLDTGQGDIPITKELLLRPYSESLNSRGGFRTDNFKISGYSSSSYILELSGINNIYSKSSGDLEFNYGNTPTTYTLNRRDMRLNSKERELNMTIVSYQSENKMMINGDVTEAELSDLDLFPSFSSWYRNNIFLAPLTLITTIFAGVTSMRSSRKIKGDSVNNDQKIMPTIRIKLETQVSTSNSTEFQDAFIENNK